MDATIGVPIEKHCTAAQYTVTTKMLSLLICNSGGGIADFTEL